MTTMTTDKDIRDSLDRLRGQRDRLNIEIQLLALLVERAEARAGAQKTKAPAKKEAAKPAQKTKAPAKKEAAKPARKSHWTPERKAAMSKKMKAKHAAKVRARG